MRSYLPTTLQSKFLVGLVLLMAGLVAFFAVTLNLHLQRLLESEARAKASLILSQVEAVQGYVRTRLRPSMYQTLPDNVFVLEAMSTSYITRAVMSDLNLAKESFTYRRVSINARNPDYEANGREIALIRRFQADPALERLDEYVKVDGKQYFVTARPQRFDASCMHCHGAPSEAPRELIALYGSERGFGRKDNDLAGIDLVSLQVERDVTGIRDATLSFAGLFTIGILLLFLFIQGFFHRLVVQSLRRVTDIMRRTFPDEAPHIHSRGGSPPPPSWRDDEIENILHGVEAFAEYLRQARMELRDYAATLEDKVAVRTRDLSRLAEEGRADVALFVSLLNSLNVSQNRQQLLKAALALIARRFGAEHATYSCVLAASDFAAWPDPTFVPEIPGDWPDLLASGVPRLTPRAWYIPVQTTGTSWGLLSLFWDSEREGSERLTDLARAIGQQMGIAMENLEALDELLRQNAMLSSLFEGIADPLMLLDAGGSVLLANTPARSLAESLDEAGFQTLLDLLSGATAEKGHGEFELRDGRVFSASVYPLAGSGSDRRLVASLRDVTMERRMEGQMLRNERIVAVGQLAAGLAHEINNPLGVIRCYTELLAASQDDPQAQSDLGVIMRHTDRARGVVRDLLGFARPRDASPGPSDLVAAARDSLDILKARAKTRRTTLVLDQAPEALSVRAGGEALEHILTNLVMNALDAVESRADGEGEVRVSVGIADGYGVLEVADNGQGIPPEHVNRVFDPFFTTKEVGKGTGLGLAVIFGIVRDLGGSIDVANAPSGGAVFRICIPLANDMDGSDD